MVSVDTVYQRVLALANKEQRGYITPQEFNLHANHAQMDIFEQYFYDLNQFKRAPSNDGSADIVGLIKEKISIFTKEAAVYHNQDLIDNFTGFYKIGEVYSRRAGYTSTAIDPPDNVMGNPFDESYCVEEISLDDVYKIGVGPLTRPTNSRPVYWLRDGKIWFIPRSAPNHSGWNTGQPYRMTYIRKPVKANWTYTVVNKKALYNKDNADHQDFELHPSEETKLVVKILQLSGITVKDYNLTQVATQKDINKIQQEKQ